MSQNKCTDKNDSIFKDWSPLPNRKLFTSKIQISSECSEDIYPNCDASIWLRSCEKEVLDPIEGELTGTIPKWLKGSLLRNGPGCLKVADMEFKHLFDSSALLHRFAIQDGKVTYQCRFLQSDVYKKNKSAKRIVVTEFGTASVPDPCQSIFKKVATIFDTSMSDNAMISVYPFGDEIYAFTEVPIIHRINKLTLETEERIDLNKYVSIVNHTSHPHVLADGTVYNLGMSVTKMGLVHNIIEFPKTIHMFENAKIVASVPVRWPLHPSYMHTFGITENYFIIVEQPLSVSIPSLVTNKIKNVPMIGSLKWFSEKATEILVICRKTGETKYKFHSEAFFFLHIINQYEKNDHIILDICCYRDPSMIDCMYIEVLKNMQKCPNYDKMFRGRPLRFSLPLNQETAKNGTIFIKPELICDLGCETPRINYDRCLGKEYRYFYAISSDVDAKNPGTIIKVDTLTKSAFTWCEDNCYPSEPIFVPSPDSKLEDDGIILSALVWGKQETHKVGLLVLNAKNMEELGRTVFQTTSEVPKCLHGWFCEA